MHRHFFSHPHFIGSHNAASNNDSAQHLQCCDAKLSGSQFSESKRNWVHLLLVLPRWIYHTNWGLRIKLSFLVAICQHQLQLCQFQSLVQCYLLNQIIVYSFTFSMEKKRNFFFWLSFGYHILFFFLLSVFYSTDIMLSLCSWHISYQLDPWHLHTLALALSCGAPKVLVNALNGNWTILKANDG